MTLLSNRTKMMLLTGLVCLFAAGTAAAQTNPATCMNDDDCVATPACGGDVCDWSVVGQMTCKAAGIAPERAGRLVHDHRRLQVQGHGRDVRGRLLHVHPPLRRAGCGRLRHGRHQRRHRHGGHRRGGGGGDGGGCSVAATAPTAASTLLVAIGLLVFARRRRGAS